VPHTDGYEEGALRVARERLLDLERRLLDLEGRMRGAIERVPTARRDSARNLVHYVALRQHDLRELQAELVELGLSSLGRAEGSVLVSVRQVLRRTLEALAARGDQAAIRELRRLRRVAGAPDWSEAKDYLHRHTREALGPRPDDRHVYVMVTAPSAAEADGPWMTKMLRAGMNVLRVNCAHEGPDEWRRIIAALEHARAEAGAQCRVVMDLAGPKIRTGPVHGGLAIATWKPRRDDLGAVIAPARVVARRRGAPSIDGLVVDLQVGAGALGRLEVGDVLRFRDARGKRRSLEVSEVDGDGAVLLARARAYVLTSVEAEILRKAERVGSVTLRVGGVDRAAIDVARGEPLILSGARRAGRPPRRREDGSVRVPGRIACTLPAALDRLEVGHRVLFDDGKIEAVVEHARPRKREFVLRVARTQKAVEKLRAEKGINLPDTVTTIPALTAEDRAALPVVAEHADAVSLSFVRRPEDVRALHDALERLGRADIGVVLKIETRAGFENLPRLLLEGLRRPPLAVMIARGDLAVEVGFERLAELQEEILWLCEAGHVPAIWATQVLDTLARTGVPSRAEVTDAAASVGAECVMLNKGPYVDEAVRVLTDILRRMEKHHFKKRSLYRKLKVSTFEVR